MIEVEVHQQLRAFLREQGEPQWHHHLTMARIVARALRLGRSALIQTGASSGYHGHYRLSYLMPVLMWQEPVILVAPEAVHQRLLMVDIPRLRQWIQIAKPIRTSDRWLGEEFRGLLLTTPQAWLSDRLQGHQRFPEGIPTIIDGADDLEAWAREQLTVQIQPTDWNELMLARPDRVDAIRDARVQLTKILFEHPPNPYECYLIEPAEQEILRDLQRVLHPPNRGPSLLSAPWQVFFQRFQMEEPLVWAEINRRQGQFSLHCAPPEVASTLEPIWTHQPVVLVGSALDMEADASIYRQQVGLGDLTSIKFSPDRQSEAIQLYLPDRLPLPNTPQFQAALLQEIRTLITLSSQTQGLAVLLVEDVPLRAQVGSILAAEFGSRVQVERTCLDDNGILVTGWEFWQQHQSVLPAPYLLAIATLPIPSLENPLVAGRVAHHKRLRQDWFRLYLLPEALGALQRAIAPLREHQGVVALFDSRVIHRTYGQQVLSALSPLARTNYLDPALFQQPDYSILD